MIQKRLTLALMLFAPRVALMGQARRQCTFFSHLKWSPVIALGYAASIAAHLWLNNSYF